VRLSPVLDLAAAKQLHAEIAARSREDLDLDASEVERIGGLCLQVLLAAKISWTESGASFRVVNPSVAFIEGVRLMGAEQHFTASGGLA